MLGQIKRLHNCYYKALLKPSRNFLEVFVIFWRVLANHVEYVFKKFLEPLSRKSYETQRID
jgi:hypothetical protein